MALGYQLGTHHRLAFAIIGKIVGLDHAYLVDRGHDRTGSIGSLTSRGSSAKAVCLGYKAMPPARRVAAIGATARYARVSLPLVGQLHP